MTIILNSRDLSKLAQVKSGQPEGEPQHAAVLARCLSVLGYGAGAPDKIIANHRDISKLAKVSSGGEGAEPPHAATLTKFALALGYKNAAAMMAAGKAARSDVAPAKSEPVPIWLRGPVVFADMGSDDEKFTANVDVRSWLAQLPKEAVRGLMEEDFTPGKVSDTALDFYEKNDPEVAKISKYLELEPTDDNGHEVGYSVYLDEESTIEWLVRNREDLRSDLLDLRAKGVIDFENDWTEDWPGHGRSHVVLVKVTCLVDKEDLDEDDIYNDPEDEEYGEDAIGGDRVIKIVSDEVISQEYAKEVALDEFHEKIGIAMRENYEITAAVIEDGSIPEDADYWGEVNSDNPGRHGSEYPEI